jgi:hypothetical protein
LTAIANISSKTISEQKILLEKSNTRKVLRRIENDTESLIVHRDTASLLSHCTDSLSKISIVFPFDCELFISRAYDKVIRGSMKEALRRQQADARPIEAISPEATTTVVKAAKVRGAITKGTEGKSAGVKGAEVKRPSALKKPGSAEETEAKIRSQLIDRRLGEDRKRLNREAKVLVLGSEDSGKEEIVKQMEIIHNGVSQKELEKYRLIIYKYTIDCAKALIRAMEQLEIQTKQEGNKEYCEYLFEYSVDPNPDKRLEAKIGHAISSIWHDPCIPEVMEHRSEIFLVDSAL